MNFLSWCSFSEEIRRSPLIHLLVGRAATTVWFLRHASLKQSGAMSCGALTLSQRSFQTLVFAPLPTVILVHHLKRAISSTVKTRGNAIHGWAGSAHLNHNHRNLSALLKHAKSFIPRPPRCLALHTLIQFTGEFPRCGSSLPFHRKFLRIRSIRPITHFESGKDVI